MKIIATTAMGNKLVALLDRNNFIDTNNISRPGVWFSGGNKNSQETLNRKAGSDISTIEIPDGYLICADPKNLREKVKSNCRVFLNCNTYPNYKGDGYLPGNCISEIDLSTLTDKSTVSVFSCIDNTKVRKVLLKHYTFLIYFPKTYFKNE